MLRLGTKYQIHNLRQEAVRCLELSFPSTRANMDALYIIESGRYDFGPVKMKDKELMDLITLARECNVLSILPAAFYRCLDLGEARLVKGLMENRWSSSDLIAFLQGERKLRDDNVIHIQRLLLSPPDDICSSPNSCCRAFDQIRKSIVPHSPSIFISSAHCLEPGL